MAHPPSNNQIAGPQQQSIAPCCFKVALMCAVCWTIGLNRTKQAGNPLVQNPLSGLPFLV
jgi:hypothetical protein